MTDTWPWQPIETAPKNGDDILVCCGPSHDPMYAVVSWDKERSGWGMWWKTPYSFADWAEYWQPIAAVPIPNGDRA